VVLDRDEQVLLVQHLVVLEVVQKRVGGRAGLCVEEHRRAGHAQRRVMNTESRKSFSAIASSRMRSLAAGGPASRWSSA
jgi:hypothetical protein